MFLIIKPNPNPNPPHPTMTEKQTHWKQYTNPEYIGAYCTPKDTTVTIVKVVREMVTGDAGRKEECTVAYLKESKPFILNRTNCKMITKVLGTPYIEQWAGKQITIYPTVTKLKGEEVECLRVRDIKPTKPILEKGSKVWTEAVKFVAGGGNAEEILKKYDVSDADMAELKNGGKA